MKAREIIERIVRNSPAPVVEPPPTKEKPIAPTRPTPAPPKRREYNPWRRRDLQPHTAPRPKACGMIKDRC